jgi:hypothetical protein
MNSCHLSLILYKLTIVILIIVFSLTGTLNSSEKAYWVKQSEFAVYPFDIYIYMCYFHEMREVDRQSGTGAGFLLILSFPLPILIPQKGLTSINYVIIDGIHCLY